MALFAFLNGLNVSRTAQIWHFHGHDVPETSGVYLLLAKPGVHFEYPAGNSPVYYIGHTYSIRDRLLTHLHYHTEARDNRKYCLYEPRNEYGATFGCRYCFIKTGRGRTSKVLEDIVLARFAKRYRSFPVANSAGAWRRIEREFKMPAK